MFKLCQRVKPGFPPSPQDTCRKLHGLIDKVDEERYDLEIKMGKADKEVNLVSRHRLAGLTVKSSEVLA